MARYEFECGACGKVFEKDFPFGKAPKTVKCVCGKVAPRHIGAVGFILKGGDWPGQTLKRKAEGTANNEEAGRRMRKSHKAPKLVDQR
jgi:putative FmdB family regulatory protein